MSRTSSEKSLEQNSLGQLNWVLASVQTRKFCSVYRAQSDEANNSPLTNDGQWTQPESKNVPQKKNEAENKACQFKHMGQSQFCSSDIYKYYFHILAG